MALINRLAGIDVNSDGPPEQQKLSIKAFVNGLYELADGAQTKANIVDYFSLSAAEETELDWVIAQYNARGTAAEKDKFMLYLGVVLGLAEEGAPGYTTNAQLQTRIQAI